MVVCLSFFQVLVLPPASFFGLLLVVGDAGDGMGLLVVSSDHDGGSGARPKA